MRIWKPDALASAHQTPARRIELEGTDAEDGRDRAGRRRPSTRKERRQQHDSYADSRGQAKGSNYKTY